MEVEEIEMEDFEGFDGFEGLQGFEDFEVLGWLEIWDLEAKELLGGLQAEDESPWGFEAIVELLEANWLELGFLVSCESSILEFLKDFLKGELEPRLGSVNS